MFDILVIVGNNPSIRVTFNQQPDPDRYAAAVLGIQAVLQLTGQADTATIWQDQGVVTDEQLGYLTDRWANSNPWS